MRLLELIFGKAVRPKSKQSSLRAARTSEPPPPTRSRRATEDAWCDLPIVGESNYQQALSDLCGGHSRGGHQLHARAELVPEPSNRYDENAVRVDIDGRTVGYLKRDHAARYVKRLLEDGRSGEVLNVRAYITGGWRTNQHDEGHFGVQLETPWPLKRRAAKT